MKIKLINCCCTYSWNAVPTSILHTVHSLEIHTIRFLVIFIHLYIWFNKIYIAVPWNPSSHTHLLPSHTPFLWQFSSQGGPTYTSSRPKLNGYPPCCHHRNITGLEKKKKFNTSENKFLTSWNFEKNESKK